MFARSPHPVGRLEREWNPPPGPDGGGFHCAPPILQRLGSDSPD
jgi:hypothetical protein